MPPNGPQFLCLNDNTSRCSAWIKPQNRCCKRPISASDKKERDKLLSQYRNSQHPQLSSADERQLLSLFFCKGWHRPGGKHAVSDLAQRSIADGLRRANLIRATQPAESQATSGAESLRANGPESPPTRPIREPEPTQHSPSGQPHSPDASTMIDPDEQRQGEPVAAEPQQRGSPVDDHGPRRSARLQQRNAVLASASSHDQSLQRADEGQSLPATAGSLEGSADANRGCRRSARLREQSTRSSASAPGAHEGIHEAPVQGQELQVAVDPIRRSPRRLPARSFGLAPSGRRDPRQHRDVDTAEECAICRDELDAPGDVARCKQCSHDFHIKCIVPSFITTPQCPYW